MRVDSSFLKVRVEWVTKCLQSKEEAHRHLAQILKFGARSIPSRPHGRFVGRVAAWLLFRQVISEALFRARVGSSAPFSCSERHFLWAEGGRRGKDSMTAS